MLRRSFVMYCFFALYVAAWAQPVDDSTYFRIPDRAKALEAIRFDLDAYGDTLRVYKDALDRASTAIDASTPQAETRRSRLGQLRGDVKVLSKDLARTRKRMKKTAPAFEEVARACTAQVRRVRLLRAGLEREGVPIGR
jgi:hypothetical protein